MAKGKARADLNKLQAVREVLDEKGKSIVPLEIQKIIKSKHGVEVPTGLISSYKFKLVGSVRKKGSKPGKKPAATTAVAPASHHPANGRRTTVAGSIFIDDITEVKKLVDSMGAEKVRQLAQVLAK